MKVKKSIWILLMAFVMSCDQQEDRLIGQWHVLSPFYKAVCQITQEKEQLVGKVLSYEDGTTFYHFSNAQPWYLFNNLKKQDGAFLDGMSGASATSKTPLTLKLISDDTLSITTLIAGQHLTEKWIKHENTKN